MVERSRVCYCVAAAAAVAVAWTAVGGVLINIYYIDVI